MANSSPTSSSSSNGSGGGSRRKSTSSRMLTSQEEDRLGKVVTSKQTFCSKIQQGRGAMVCIFLELKDVNGGENPGEPMDIEAHPLLSNAERASSDNERLKMNFKGTIVPQFRDFLYTHSTTLDADTPIRCLIGGYGARFTSRKVVMFDKDELVVRLWPPSQLKASRQSKRSNLGEGSSSQTSDNGDESHLWFTRYRIEEPQATQLDDMSPTAPNLSAPVENSQAVDALIGIGAHAFDAQHVQESNGGGGDGVASQSVASQQEQEGEEQEPHDPDQTAMQEPVAQEPVAQQPTSEPASEPSSWPSDLVASPPPASPQHDSPQPDSATNSGVPAASQSQPQDGVQATEETSTNLSAALHDGAHIGDENTAAEPPAASTPPPPPPSAEHTAQSTAGDDWFATPQQKQHDGPSGSAPPDDDPNAPDASELLAEAEATQFEQQQQAAMPPPQHPSSWPSVKLPARLLAVPSSTPVTPLNDCSLDGARYKFMAIVHTCQTPRRTNGASKDYSMQVVLVDRSGYLKTMFFASRAEDLTMLAVGTTILVEPVNIQEWPGARNPRQGRADKGQWKAACMLVPSAEEPVDSGSMATRSTLRPTEQEYHDMLALRNWYHFDGGSEESIRKYPMAWIRPTKTVAEIKGKPTEWGGNEFFDLLAQVLEFYPPLGPNQPASVYVTDYTWHDGLRAIYEQHLGYEEDEYMPRAVKTKIGGGRVLQIALFEKQAHALYGLERGKFVLFTSLRSRWTADYGLSAAVGSDTDFSLRLREGSHDPGMPQLLARKKEWEAQREVELKQRREAEEENEEAWREAHEQELAGEEEREVAAEEPGQPLQVVKQEQRSASAEAREEREERVEAAVEQQAGEGAVHHGQGGGHEIGDDAVAAEEANVQEHAAAAESSDAQAAVEASTAQAEAEDGNAQVGAEEERTNPGAAEDNPLATEADKEPAEKTASNGPTSEADDVVMAADEDAAEHEENAQAAVEQSGRDESVAGEDASMAAVEEEQQPEASREEEQQAGEPAAAEPTEEQEMAPVDDAPPVEEMARIDDMPHDNGAPPPRARARIVMDTKAFEQAATSASYTPDAIQTMTVSEIADLFPPDRPELHDFTVYAKLERAKILDIKPRDSMQWIRATKKKGKELMLALLLAEEGGEQAGEIDPRRCLPVVLSGEQADGFFGVDRERLAYDAGYEEEARAVVKAKLEGLMTLEQVVEESQTQEDEVDARGNIVAAAVDGTHAHSEDDTWRRHDFGLAIWVGKKTGKRQVSIWGCSVEDGV